MGRRAATPPRMHRQHRLRGSVPPPASGWGPAGNAAAAAPAGPHRHRAAAARDRTYVRLRPTEPGDRTAWPPAAAASPARSVLVADFDDFVLAGAAGRFDDHAVAFVLADQGTRDRRRDRDQPELDVGLQVANDLVAPLFIRLDVGHRDLGAEYDPVAGIELAHVDHVGMRQLAFQLLDAAFDEALLFAGSVVLGVLLQVAMRACLGDGIDHRGALDGLEFLQFGAQALRALQCHGCSHLSSFLMRPCAVPGGVPAVPRRGRCPGIPGSAATPWRRQWWSNRSRAAAVLRDGSRTNRRSPAALRWY